MRRASCGGILDLRLVGGEGARMSGEQRLEGSANQFAKLEDPRVGDVVDHAGPVTTTAQDARLGQSLEVSRGIGLGQPCLFYEIGD